MSRMSCKPILLFVLYFLLTIGEALKCYECTSEKNTDCYSPIDKTVIQSNDCRDSPYIAGNLYHAKYECVAYKEHNVVTNRTFVGRHCIVKKDDDFCTRYKIDRYHHGYSVDECNTCSEDLCNSGVSSKIVFGAFSLIVLVLCMSTVNNLPI